MNENLAQSQKSSPDPGLPSPERLDQFVAILEDKLLQNRNDVQAAAKLVDLLDFHIPQGLTSGRYTECQRKLTEGNGNDFRFDELLVNQLASARYKEWSEFLRAQDIEYLFPIGQLHTGMVHSIDGNKAMCSFRLELFNKVGAISRLCLDCYKVQILPTNVIGLINLYFVLRALKFPRDNARKCMIELREGVPYPYKGYIYCESEEEAEACRNMVLAAFEEYGIADQFCAISHGCSEYSLKFPAFKYSADGAHKKFERPKEWDQLESKHFAQLQRPRHSRNNNNTIGITIKDIVGFQTWRNYAELIGDESSRQFQDNPVGRLPEPWATQVRMQSKMRKEQLDELRARFVTS